MHSVPFDIKVGPAEVKIPVLVEWESDENVPIVGMKFTATHHGRQMNLGAPGLYDAILTEIHDYFEVCDDGNFRRAGDY